ncbi:MAG: hypothetical protein ABSE15_08720 [Candidatus Bathyarchaeia archaeon]
MLKRTLNLEIEKTYADVKVSLVSKGCKVLSEDTPKHLLVKQGSLWGMLPETAKKTVDFTLSLSTQQPKLLLHPALAQTGKTSL